VAVRADGIASVIKVNAIDPRQDRMTVGAQPIIMCIGGVTSVARETLIGVDVVEVQNVPTAGNVAA
jgi:hypothetical protein